MDDIAAQSGWYVVLLSVQYVLGVKLRAGTKCDRACGTDTYRMYSMKYITASHPLPSMI